MTITDTEKDTIRQEARAAIQGLVGEVEQLEGDKLHPSHQDNLVQAIHRRFRQLEGQIEQLTARVNQLESEVMRLR